MNVSHQKVKGFVIAGTQSDVGKTSVSSGLMHSLTRRGKKVMPFKVGPDYIDPGHHSRACGRPGYNLDSFMCSRKYVSDLFFDIARESDLAIVEGVMGLFDGASPISEKGSTAEIAKLLNLPIILIFNGEATARSAAALVQGFINFDPELKFIGAIANRVTHPGHAKILKTAIEHHTSLRFLGHLPFSPDLTLNSRHLGLLQKHEIPGSFYEQWADHLESHIDIQTLLKSIDASKKNTTKRIEKSISRWKGKPAKPAFKVAVAKDDAFTFFYQDTLDVLEHSGAEIHFFSPLIDKRLPKDCDWIYLPGGYPEIHAKKLSENKSMLRCLRSFANSGKVIVAECGGMMYLGKSIVDENNKSRSMVGLFNFSTSLAKNQLTLGYRTLKYRPMKESSKDIVLKGHEFHYSSFIKNRESPQMRQNKHGRDSQIMDGYVYKNCFATYSHVYWASSLNWLKFILAKTNRIQG